MKSAFYVMFGNFQKKIFLLAGMLLCTNICIYPKQHTQDKISMEVLIMSTENTRRKEVIRMDVLEEGYKVTYYPPGKWDEDAKCDNCSNNLKKTGAWEFPDKKGTKHGSDEEGTRYYCTECAPEMLNTIVDEIREEVE